MSSIQAWVSTKYIISIFSNDSTLLIQKQILHQQKTVHNYLYLNFSLREHIE